MPTAPQLPIFEIRAALSAALTEPGARIILSAPTGSGKSTQIPQMAAELPPIDGAVHVLQPRRLAARMLAQRVAQESGTALGKGVGYHVRGEHKASAATQILFLTEGMFLRRLMGTPDLRGVDVVVLDEFHERNLDGDIALAACLQLQAEERPDLRIIVMSATLPGGALEDHLSPCTRIEASGRSFPVEIKYRGGASGAGAQAKRGRAGLRQKTALWDHAEKALRSALQGGEFKEGHALVFMPGKFEIDRSIGAISRASWARDFDVLPLHGALPRDQQDRAVLGGPSDRRRIIVSTNVAETSLTIEGIRLVVDSGLARAAAFDRHRGINTLTVGQISLASAEQRAGRAGRTGPGTCIRLWAERTHHTRPADTPAEISTLDLSEAVLNLLSSGLGPPEDLPWFEAPAPESLAVARRLLRQLGALPHEEGDDQELTDLGKRMARLPLHPRLSRMVIAAEDKGFGGTGSVCAALICSRDLFVKAPHPRFEEADDRSDLLSRLRAFDYANSCGFRLESCADAGIHAGGAREVASQLDSVHRAMRSADMQREDAFDPSHEDLAKIILSAFSDQVSVRTTKGGAACRIVGGRRGRIHSETVIGDAPLFVASRIDEVEGKELQVILQHTTAIEEPWLRDLFPDDFSDGTTHRFDQNQRRVVCARGLCFRDLVIAETSAGEPELGPSAELLATEVAEGRLVLKRWDHKVEQWVARLNCLAEWMPELGLTPITGDDRHGLLAQLCYGATLYKQIKDRDPWPTLYDWLPPGGRDAIDQLAPTRLKLASGEGCAITYAEGSPPKIGATVQRLYDQKTNPTVAGGRVVVQVEVLSPARRPVQVTQDLAGFWANSYEAVKKDLKGRYPKHEWR